MPQMGSNAKTPQNRRFQDHGADIPPRDHTRRYRQGRPTRLGTVSHRPSAGMLTTVSTDQAPCITPDCVLCVGYGRILPGDCRLCVVGGTKMESKE